MLICVNIFTDYLLLLLTTQFIGIKVRVYRLILGALEGGLFSLYIFVPSPTPLTLAVQAIVAVLIIITIYGIKNKQLIFKAFICFYLMSFCLSGLLFLIWTVFKLPGLILKNGVFYFNISPLVLILSTSLCYIIIKLVYYIVGKHKTANDFCKIEIFKSGKACRIIAKIDSGNTLKEPFSGLPVVVVDKALIKDILTPPELELYCKKTVSSENMATDTILKQRIIPFSTVAGKGYLIAFKPDFIMINNEKKDAYIGVCTNDELRGEVRALVNPDLL